MDKGLITQLQILKLSNIKPNFSELARLYDLDRRTVKRFYDGYEGKPKHHNKSSRLDEHYDLIKTKLSLRGANVRAVYEYIMDEVDSGIGTYSNFNKYVKSKGLKPKKTEKGHPRYETDMGVQAQVDWKKDVTLHNRYGEPFTFQVFDYKLGYSRYPVFTYKLYKTRQDVFDCLIASFKATGGVPRDIQVKPEKVYACYNKDKDVRLSSSSGAVFSSLAEYVLNKSGIVYGVAMSEDCYSAEFIGVTDSEGLTKLRGSKYLQAKVGNTFKSVKKELQAGKLVLFTGTGCQVNGLKTFLGKDYDNLICMDVICHGAPSPALWREYARDQEKKMGGKLKEINFRCKDDSWVDFGMKEVLSTIPEDSVKKFYISKDKDPYMQMFLRDYCLRPSCYECMVKKEKMSDLTVADFWGIKDVAPEMNNGLGTSLVLIRTKKGQEIFNYISCEMKLKEVTYEAGVKGNPAEYKSCVRPSQRDTFFDDMHTMSFEELEGKYAPPIKYSLKTRAKRKTKKIMKSMLRVIGGAESNVEYGLLFVFRV